MNQPTFSNPRGPSKPPLPNPLNVPIPNSNHLTSITNTTFQNFMTIQATPPPPPVQIQLPQTQQHNQYIYNNNNNNNFPPGLPIPTIAKMSNISHMANITNISSTGNIPITSYVSPDPFNKINNTIQNNNINNINNINININNNGNVGKVTKSRKRVGKRRGNKKSKVEKKETETKDKETMNENENDINERNDTSHTNDKETEAINDEKRNLINAIELERRNHELTKLRLYQLHSHYGEMLKNLKKESGYLKNKINMLNNGPSQTDLEVILKQKQSLRNDYLRKREIRLKDEQQIKQTNKENQKLFLVIQYQKQELDALLVQYQQLCQTETNCNGNDREYSFVSDAQQIVNNLDSLDIVDAESMVNHDKHELLNINNNGQNIVVSSHIYDNPWFQNIIEENRMLERHIRFLRHIIERETQRCNFKEIIVGKRSMDSMNSIELKSPEKIKIEFQQK